MQIIDKLSDTLSGINAWIQSVSYESLVNTKLSIRNQLQKLGNKDEANSIIRSTNSDVQNGTFTMEEFK